MRARDIIGVCSLACLLACVSVALACTPVARAESRARRPISWPEDLPSGAECASYTQVERRIEAELGGSLSDADFNHTFRAEIEKRDHRWYLFLVSEHDGERTERTFEGESCREVTDAAILLIALSLDDVRRARADAANGVGNAASAPGDVPEPAAGAPEVRSEIETQALPATGKRLRWGPHASALLELGILPRAAAGLELGVSASWASSLVSLTGVGLPGVRSQPVPDGSRVKVALWAARLRYCHRALGASALATARVHASLGVCGGAELGEVSGDGIGLRDVRRGDFVWGAGWLGLRAALALTSQLGLHLEPALVMPVSRRRFVSSDAQGGTGDILHTPALLSVRIGLGVEARF